MTRTISTRRLLAQNFSSAVVWGVAGPLATFFWRDGITREPNAMVLSLLASAAAFRISPRAKYTETLLATLGAAAVFVGTYVAGEWIVRLLGAPPPWLPDRSWLVLWGTGIIALTLVARYSTVVGRARRIRTQRSPAPAVQR